MKWRIPWVVASLCSSASSLPLSGTLDNDSFWEIMDWTVASLSSSVMGLECFAAGATAWRSSASSSCLAQTGWRTHWPGGICIYLCLAQKSVSSVLLPWDGNVALPAVSVSRELLLNMLAMATLKDKEYVNESAFCGVLPSSGQKDKSMNAYLTNFIRSNRTFLASVVTCEWTVLKAIRPSLAQPLTELKKE